MKLTSVFARDLQTAYASGTPDNENLLAHLNEAVGNPDQVTLLDGFAQHRNHFKFETEEVATYFRLAALGCDMAARHAIQGHKLRLADEAGFAIVDDTTLPILNVPKGPFRLFCIQTGNDAGEQRPAIVTTLSHIANSLLSLRYSDHHENANFSVSMPAHCVLAMGFEEEARHAHQHLAPPEAVRNHFRTMPRNVPSHIVENAVDMAAYELDHETDVRNILHEDFLQGEGIQACDEAARRPVPERPAENLSALPPLSPPPADAGQFLQLNI